jgi:signal transduction histidine kinase
VLDAGQLLERFRQLSRDIQNGLQKAQKQLSKAKQSRNVQELGALETTLSEISDSWQDYAGWILISTLDDPNETRQNCAPGRVDVASKLMRAKIKRRNETGRHGINIDITEADSIVIETFIPYFEQMLDLLFGNAIKYSLKGGAVEVFAKRSRANVAIEVRSLGPVVLQSELPHLGTRGFRAQAACKLPVTGQGYGLFNVCRIAELLGATCSFRSDQRIAHTDGSGVQYSLFAAIVTMPESPPPPSAGKSPT